MVDRKIMPLKLDLGPMLDKRRHGRNEQMVSIIQEESGRGPGQLVQVKLLQRLAEHSQTSIDTLCKIGKKLLEFDNHRNARRVLEEAIKRDGNNVTANLLLGQVFMELRDYSSSSKFLRAALSLAPRDTRTMTKLGQCLSLWGGNAEEALELFNEAIGVDKGCTEAYSGLVIQYLRRREPQLALEICQQAISAFGPLSDFLSLLSVAIGETGDMVALKKLVDFDHLLWEILPKASCNPAPREWNSLVADEIVGHQLLEYEPKTSATREGWHANLPDVENSKPLKLLSKYICREAEKYIKSLERMQDHPMWIGKPERLRLQMWGSVLMTDGHLTAHFHPSGWISGVYYVEVPACANTSRSGWIEFGPPHRDFHLRHTPPSKFVKPREGLLLLFPSFFFHSTLPLDGAPGRRISIGFDLMPP